MRIITTAAVLIISAGHLVTPYNNDLATKINLSGVPGPYAFQHFCRTDSGDLWIVGGNGTIQRRSNRNGPAEFQVSTKALNGVYFVNGHTGWAVGEDGLIVHTQNQGLGWRKQASSTTENLNAITCIDQSTCWCVGNKGSVLYTNNEGRRWRKLEKVTEARLNAVRFVSSRSGWAVGDDGLVLHTTNGGRSWRMRRVNILIFPKGPFGGRTDLLAVSFIDKFHGWVAGAGGIARTINGGRTWKVHPIEGTFIGLTTRDGKEIFAVNTTGSNYRSHNGGMTWGPQH